MIRIDIEFPPPNPMFSIWLVLPDGQRHRILGNDAGRPGVVEDYWRKAATQLGLPFEITEPARLVVEDVRAGDRKFSRFQRWWLQQTSGQDGTQTVPGTGAQNNKTHKVPT